MKTPPSIRSLAARRLNRRTQDDFTSRAASVRQALQEAFVRLDWREARRQAELLSAMGAGALPLSQDEQTALFERFARLIAEAQARCAAQGRLS